MIPATITHPRESLEGSSFTNRSRRTSQCLPSPLPIRTRRWRDSRATKVHFTFESMKAHPYMFLLLITYMYMYVHVHVYTSDLIMIYGYM